MPVARDERPALTILEVARRLGCHRVTVYRMVKRGALAHTRVETELRIPAAAYDAYVEARTSTTWQPAARGRAAQRRGEAA